MRSRPLSRLLGVAVAARAAAKVPLGPWISASLGLFEALFRKRKRGGLGFNMSKVSDEPLKDYDSGPKTFEILKYPHPALRRGNAEVTDFGPKLRQLSENLFRTMYARDDGCGLAAPQCGVNLRVGSTQLRAYYLLYKL